MAVSKVIINGVTQIDVTTDTVDAASLLSGYTATKNDGTKINGSLVPSTPSTASVTLSPAGNTLSFPTISTLPTFCVLTIPNPSVNTAGITFVSKNGSTIEAWYADSKGKMYTYSSISVSITNNQLCFYSSGGVNFYATTYNLIYI